MRDGEHRYFPPKHRAGFAVVTATILLTVSTLNAQSTNVVQHASFVLKATRQNPAGTVSDVRITNKDILAALNATGDYNFAPGTALLFVTINGQPPTISVRQTNRGEVIDTDVGAYFGIAEVGDEVHSRDGLTRWATLVFSLDNGQSDALDTGFQLWGRTTLMKRSRQLVSTVNGVGRLAGAVTIFSGTVQATASPTFFLSPKP